MAPKAIPSLWFIIQMKQEKGNGKLLRGSEENVSKYLVNISFI
jgi:hypothetical protein